MLLGPWGPHRLGTKSALDSAESIINELEASVVILLTRPRLEEEFHVFHLPHSLGLESQFGALPSPSWLDSGWWQQSALGGD